VLQGGAKRTRRNGYMFTLTRRQGLGSPYRCPSIAAGLQFMTNASSVWPYLTAWCSRGRG